MTDNRTLKDLTCEDLDGMTLEQWAKVAKRTEPAAVVDLVVSCSKGEIPIGDAVMGGQAIYRNRREHGIED